MATATKTRLWYSLPVLLAPLSGCGAEADLLSTPPASNAPCAASALCPDGERCDDGLCVADAICPSPVSPKAVGPVVEAVSWGYFSLQRVGLQQYVVETSPDALTNDEVGASMRARFTDLVDGTTSDLPHETGHVGCMGEPLFCYVTPQSGDGSVLTGVSLDRDQGVWVAENAFSGVVPSGNLIYGGVEAPEYLWLYDWLSMSRLTPSTGLVEPWIDLEGKKPFYWIYPPTSSRAEGLATFENGPEAEVSFAALTQGAKPTPIATIQGGFHYYLLPIAWGDNWKLVYDVPMSLTFRVVDVVDGVSTVVGETDDVGVRAVAERYLTGSPAIGDGVGTAVDCDNEQCRLVRADLRDASVSTLASAVPPGSGSLRIHATRWLACGGVDVVVSRAEVGEGDRLAYHLWQLRLLP